MTGPRRWRFRLAAAAVAILAVATVLAVATPSATERAPTLLLPAGKETAAPVAIGTMPPVQGFPITLDGVTQLTDRTGQAHFIARGVGNQLTGRVRLNRATVTVGGRQVQAVAAAFYPFRSAPVVALQLSYAVQFQFTGRRGTSLDASAVRTLVVKSDTGQVLTVPPGKPSWLLGTVVHRSGSDLRAGSVDWRVQRVEYLGSNVVNSSQQEFRPADQSDVGVELLFFHVHAQTHDALFGFSRAGTLEVGYPDGSRQRFALDAHGRATLPDLPRGNYTVTVLGLGPTMTRPLTVSRDQELRLAVYSWWDVLTILGGALMVAAALAGSGRRRRRRSRPAAAVSPDGDEPLEPAPLEPAPLEPLPTGATMQDGGP